MIFLPPETCPAQRLLIVQASARLRASRRDALELVRLVRSVIPRQTETDTARALLALVAASPNEGRTERDVSRGQWLNDDVLATVTMGGDCVDRTHALLCLAYAAGLDGHARWIPEPGVLDHMAPRIRSDGLWHWADPLQRPAVLGVAPRGGAPQVAGLDC